MLNPDSVSRPPASTSVEDLEERLAALASEREALLRELAAARAAAGGEREDDRLRIAFFAMASHELRTPLQSLALNVSVMLTRVRGTADEIPAAWIRGRLERTQGLVDRMRRLVDGLLNVSEIASGRLQLQRERLELGELAGRVVDGVSDALAWAGCTCEVVVEEPVYGEWDRLRVELVLENLLGNAMKYAPGQPIAVRVGPSGSFAGVSVRDRGPGIPPEDRSRIFERFERGESSARVGGFGLGLWIVRAIAEGHGGTVRLESELGEGSTFTILLPRAPGS
jgi:signal transduction histidine kinase